MAALATIFNDCYTILRSASSSEDILHKYHFHYQKKIFDYLRAKYLADLRAWWATYTLPIATDRYIFFYEPRCHENLEFLIYNLTYFARGWGLIIYCSKENYDYITDILKHNKLRALLFIVRDNQGGPEARNDYNALLMSAEFWNSIPCKYILTGEMDTYLRKALPDDVVNYDYVCAKWPWHPDSPGGSGLSIRRVEAMKQICCEFPTLSTEIPHQDVWVSTGCSRLKLTYNNRYFVEADHHNKDPVGFHNWWTFFDPPKAYIFSDTFEHYLTLEI